MTRLDRFIHARTFGRFTVMEDPYLVCRARYEIRKRRDAETTVLAMPSARAGRVSPRAGARLGHPATITIAKKECAA